MDASLQIFDRDAPVLCGRHDAADALQQLDELRLRDAKGLGDVGQRCPRLVRQPASVLGPLALTGPLRRDLGGFHQGRIGDPPGFVEVLERPVQGRGSLLGQPLLDLLDQLDVPVSDLRYQLADSREVLHLRVPVADRSLNVA